MKHYRVAIVGYGAVGKAMHRLFPDGLIYNGERHPVKTVIDGRRRAATYDDVNTADVAFICVPTPRNPDGHCDISIVASTVKDITTPLIIIRSTIPPGTTDALKKKYNKHIVFCPEYIGETTDHPLLDERRRTFLILGGDRKDSAHAIRIFQQVYNASVKIRQMSAKEAEMAKYLENRHIAFTVAECNEAYDLCQTAGVDYNAVREAVFQDDPRMSPYWTFVYPDNRGFETKCIPKDIEALVAYARDLQQPLPITEKILDVNKSWRKKG